MGMDIWNYKHNYNYNYQEVFMNANIFTENTTIDTSRDIYKIDFTMFKDGVITNGTVYVEAAEEKEARHFMLTYIASPDIKVINYTIGHINVLKYNKAPILEKFPRKSDNNTSHMMKMICVREREGTNANFNQTKPGDIVYVDLNSVYIAEDGDIYGMTFADIDRNHYIGNLLLTRFMTIDDGPFEEIPITERIYQPIKCIQTDDYPQMFGEEGKTYWLDLKSIRIDSLGFAGGNIYQSQDNEIKLSRVYLKRFISITE